MALGLGSAGCDVALASASTASLTYTENARAAYNEAMTAFRDKDWEDAIALFTELRSLFPQSRYARLAELRLADIAFAQEKFTDAIAAYREFVTTHRTNRDVEYAKYRMTKALFLDIEDTFLLPPAEERDQATTKEAYRELRQFLRDYPTTRYRRDAAFMLESVTGRLVRHELYVARYYLKEDSFEATIARVDYALKNYPGSALHPEALVLKGETLMKMGEMAQAKTVFELVLSDYGGPFAVTAQDFLDELKSPSQPPADVRRRPRKGPPPLTTPKKKGGAGATSPPAAAPPPTAPPPAAPPPTAPPPTAPPPAPQ